MLFYFVGSISTSSPFGQDGHLFFHACLKEFCQEGRKHPPESYSMKQMKFVVVVVLFFGY